MQPETTPPGQLPAAPGSTVSPGQPAAPTPDPAPLPPPQPVVQPTQPTQPTRPDPGQPPADDEAISWTASEFIAHQKSAGWYMALVAAAVLAAAVVYLLTRDFISTGMIGVVLIVLLLLASRKPRTISYQLNQAGIQINTRHYPYADFKSFSVVDEGAVSSITLIPLKRFMPPITMYFEPKDESRIGEVLSDYLPYEEHQRDVVDQFMRRIRL